MTIVTTFNDRLYKYSGKNLLKTIQKYFPNEKVIIYEELDDTKNAEELILSKYELVNIKTLKELNEMLELHKDVIPKHLGGTSTQNFNFWNKRWFGWFRKILMWHDVICNKKLDGPIIFVDSDIRFIESFNDQTLIRLTNKKPISFFKGQRAQIESGCVVVNGSSEESIIFYNCFMDLFISGKFKKYSRWDDSNLMTELVYKYNFPKGWFNDFAEGKGTTKHRNSNGHATNQIINSTEFTKYIEHDKGMHANGWNYIKNLK